MFGAPAPGWRNPGQLRAFSSIGGGGTAPPLHRGRQGSPQRQALAILRPCFSSGVPFPMSNSRLNPMDASWLAMEAHATPMHVGVLAIFSIPPKAPPDYVAGLVQDMQEYRDPVAPWRQIDAEFDLDYHFRHSALPAPGGERELGAMVSRLHSNPLDRTRPLWECHLVEGLEDDRFAIYLKVHRAILGGISAVPAFLERLSSSARARNIRQFTGAGQRPVFHPESADQRAAPLCHLAVRSGPDRAGGTGHRLHGQRVAHLPLRQFPAPFLQGVQCPAG